MSHARVIIPLSLVLTTWLASLAARADPVSETWTRQRVGPGEVAVYWIQREGPAIRLFTDHPKAPAHRLTPDAEAALELAPLWLRPALFDKLGQLPTALQDQLAATIAQALR